tara:strand:- start:21252 stop:21677 length:426 start_codon:yes stop_codon:yes gene_type:complete
MIKPKVKSVLSLDIGRKRIGFAGCDPLGISITPLPAIHRKDLQLDIALIKKYCLQRSVKGLVIGLPLDSNGRETSQSSYTKSIGLKIARELNLPIAWVNEQCSTWQAQENLNIKNDRSGKIDSTAAALLLEQWLNEGPDFE